MAERNASSPPAAGPLIGDITDILRIEFVGAALIVRVARVSKPALEGIFSLRPGCVRLTPPELDAPTKFAMPS